MLIQDGEENGHAASVKKDLQIWEFATKRTDTVSELGRSLIRFATLRLTMSQQNSVHFNEDTQLCNTSHKISHKGSATTVTTASGQAGPAQKISVGTLVILPHCEKRKEKKKRWMGKSATTTCKQLDEQTSNLNFSSCEGTSGDEQSLLALQKAVVMSAYGHVFQLLFHSVLWERIAWFLLHSF